MPKNSNKVPDAWEDDWETQADQMGKEEEAPEQPTILPRTERLARHAEAQRKLWESAEAPEENHFLAASSNPPLASNFKPAMKLLSRKPAPQMIAKRDPVTGIEQLTLQDDDAEDESAKPKQPTPGEIKMRQQRELEEKQRRYEEARAKIFGDSNTSSGRSTPGNVTPPTTSEGRQSQRKQGRGRGGHRNDSRSDSRPDSWQDTHARRAPAGSQSGSRELYDPNYSPKPGFAAQKRDNETGARELYDPNYSPKSGFATQRRDNETGSPKLGGSTTPREEDQILRSPRGPDASGRSGFNFSRRGAKDG